jgi:hypothetical protein
MSESGAYCGGRVGHCSGCEIGPPATVKKCSFSEALGTTWQHTSALKNPYNIVPLEQASNVFDRSKYDISEMRLSQTRKYKAGRAAHQYNWGKNVVLA